ncbi:MAG: transcriptional repressor [Candidatus Latescibacteria bacterium]|nr:transcriptional repressor [Candidatus Latescibacterota bacterium]
MTTSKTTSNPEQISVQSASQRLRRAGYRITQQRLAVYAFLHGSGSHPTVEEIHATVKDAFPKISVATVYKSVESLVDVGLVKPIYLGHAATRYDASSQEHAHFRCIACSQIMDIPMDKSPSTRDGLDRCEIIGSSVEFYGFCPGCRRHKLGLAPD